MINITVEGIDKLKDVFKKAPEKAERAIRRAIQKSTMLIWGKAKENIDKMTESHTGFLKTRWEVKMTTFKSTLRPLVFYAPYVHEGTKAHIILPVIKKALFWKGARHPVKVVHHPGTKARPFLLRAVEDSVDKIKKFFKEELEAIFK